ADLLNNHTMSRLRDVFREWVGLDGGNCDLLRNGLLRFRMPEKYEVIQSPLGWIGEMGQRSPELSQMHCGILAAAESAECIGGQLGMKGDRAAALFAGLFVNHLNQGYRSVFQGYARWDKLPGDLGRILCDGLKRASNG